MNKLVSRLKSLGSFSKRQGRNSNVELFRVALMIAICVWHIMVHGFGYVYLSSGADIQIPWTRWLVMTLTVPAVDCFMLLSGYYGIRFSIRKLFHFWFLGIAVMLLCYGHYEQQIVSYIFPMTSGKWWFMQCYILVMLVSPFINHGLKTISDAVFIKVLICLFFINSIIKTIHLQFGGSDFISLLIIYLIGCALKRFNIISSIKLGGGIFTLSTIVLFCFALIINAYVDRINVWILMCYNNPLVIFQAIGLVAIVVNLRPRYSSLINFMGQNSLSIYLITELVFMYKWWAQLWERNLLQCVAVILGVSCCCILYGGGVSFISKHMVDGVEKVIAKRKGTFMTKFSNYLQLHFQSNIDENS